MSEITNPVERAEMLAAAERDCAWDVVEVGWYEAGWMAALASRATADRAELDALREALNKAAGRLGYLSTLLTHSNKPSNAKGAWEWSEEARAAAAAPAAERRPADDGDGGA